MASSVTPLQNFLLSHRVKKGDDFTHTSLASPKGSFYIGGDDDLAFTHLYMQEYNAGSSNLHLTEKPKDIFPAVVDLDLRYPLHSGLARRHSLEDVAKFVKIYVAELNKLLQLDDHVDVYVLQKPSPVEGSAVVKDGLHLVLPSVVTLSAVQLMVREACLPQVEGLFERLGSVNSVEDVYDESVLGKNNWMMMGSRKPGQAPYGLSAVLRWHARDGSVSEAPEALPPNEALPLLLSIRNKYVATRIRGGDVERRVYERQDALFAVRRPAAHGDGGSPSRGCTNECDTFALETLEELVDMLDASRADGYQTWMRAGWMLRNIDHRLLAAWVRFSQKSSKYQEGECEAKWRGMQDEARERRLGIGTLLMWAKEDDPDRYRHVRHKDLTKALSDSCDGSHTDVARVVKRMYGDRFVCASLRLNAWYEFRGHRWFPSDGACELRKLLSTEVHDKYDARAKELEREADGLRDRADSMADSSERNEVDKDMKDKYLKAKSFRTVAKNLKDTNYKDKVLKECREHFYVEKFEEKLDANPVLLGFENGVYDLEKHEFRDGMPEDYLTYSTGNAYAPFDPDHPCVAEIYRFFGQVQPKAHMREYLLTLMASFLTGHIIEEKFHIMTGTGSNGKSKCMELFENVLGDYCCKFPVTLLTQKRIASNAANAELARAKGRRVASMQEPSESEHLNIGLMKELSGGDKITARALYSMPVEFKPMFSMVLMCNHLPSCPSDDNGTWRRIRVVEFASKFVHEPNPADPNQFPIDLELSRKFGSWLPHFMGLLLEYYRAYQVNGLAEPPEVLATTKEYQRSNDFIADFISDKIEMNAPGVMLDVNDMYAEFKEWWRLENMKGTQPRRRELVVVMERKYGRTEDRDGCQFFKNMRIRTSASA
jgi:P4 family phage/plasmid primase-like protien